MTTPYQYGIKDYQPDFVATTDQLIKKKGDLLYQLIGKTIVSIFVVWSKEHNQEWLDAPIVLNFGDFQVELCAQKTDEFSITVDSFDLNTELNWYGDDRFEWKSYTKLDNNFTIEKVKIIELENEISNVSGNPGFKHTWWSLGGIQFLGGSAQISIYNGFDCNCISLGPLMDKGLRTKNLHKGRAL